MLISQLWRRTATCVVATALILLVTAVVSPNDSAAQSNDHCPGGEITVFLENGDTPTPGDDVIMGTSGDDIISGRGGNDIICGLGGNDQINGNGGHDVIYAGPGDDIVSGGDGNDVIYGQWDNDRLLGNSGRDELHGEFGNDELIGGAGTDTLRGGDGDDILDGSSGPDWLGGGNGNDELYGGVGADELLGQAGNDNLYGGQHGDKLVGGDGHDILEGDGGNDTLNGNAGIDLIRGGDGNDVLRGGTGDDILGGGPGNDTLRGDSGKDSIFGGDGIDTLDPGEGDWSVWEVEVMVDGVALGAPLPEPSGSYERAHQNADIDMVIDPTTQTEVLAGTDGADVWVFPGTNAVQGASVDVHFAGASSIECAATLDDSVAFCEETSPEHVSLGAGSLSEPWQQPFVVGSVVVDGEVTTSQAAVVRLAASAADGAPVNIGEPLTGYAGDADCDGDVDLLDARWVAQFAIGVQGAPSACGDSLAVDIDGDGQFDLLDARHIARCVIGFTSDCLIAEVTAGTFATPGSIEVSWQASPDFGVHTVVWTAPDGTQGSQEVTGQAATITAALGGAWEIGVHVGVSDAALGEPGAAGLRTTTALVAAPLDPAWTETEARTGPEAMIPGSGAEFSGITIERGTGAVYVVDDADVILRWNSIDEVGFSQPVVLDVPFIEDLEGIAFRPNSGNLFALAEESTGEVHYAEIYAVNGSFIVDPDGGSTMTLPTISGDGIEGVGWDDQRDGFWVVHETTQELKMIPWFASGSEFDTTVIFDASPWFTDLSDIYISQIDGGIYLLSDEDRKVGKFVPDFGTGQLVQVGGFLDLGPQSQIAQPEGITMNADETAMYIVSENSGYNPNRVFFKVFER